MKKILLTLILLSSMAISKAQTNGECITIISSNLSEDYTTVVEVTKYDDKIVVLSERDGKSYNLSISLDNATEFYNEAVAGRRVFYQTKDGIKYISIERFEDQILTVWRFKICI